MGLLDRAKESVEKAKDISLDLVSDDNLANIIICLLYTSPSPRDATLSRMPSSA